MVNCSDVEFVRLLEDACVEAGLELDSGEFFGLFEAMAGKFEVRS